MAQDISNSDSVIDSRDVIARIEELKSERQDLADQITDEDEQAKTRSETRAALREWDDENGDELKALQALADEAAGYSDDWRHGVTLIRDSYFVEYTQELLQDIGDLPRNMPAYLVIDWEATAANIQVDYTNVDYDGVTYWIR